MDPAVRWNHGISQQVPGNPGTRKRNSGKNDTRCSQCNNRIIMKHTENNKESRMSSGVASDGLIATKKGMRWIYPLRKRRKGWFRIRKWPPHLILVLFTGAYSLSRWRIMMPARLRNRKKIRIPHSPRQVLTQKSRIPAITAHPMAWSCSCCFRTASRRWGAASERPRMPMKTTRPPFTD